MEYLDVYDENKNYLGKELRKVVHEKALWHNTVHCWLYDVAQNVYFQIRKEEGKFYTTASGHVLAGETIQEAFKREVEEEIGINIDTKKAEFINSIPFILDRENKDGTMFRDRAFSNIYAYQIEEEKFSFDPEEVRGMVKVNAKKALDLFKEGKGSIDAQIINLEKQTQKRKVDFTEFLVNKGETALEKYGEILEFIIQK